MKLNSVERFLMNNPVRAAIQRHVDAAHFQRLGAGLRGQDVLEVGCGRGIGIEILLDRFRAAHVSGFDFDARMIEQARRRLSGRYSPERWSLFVADAGAIPAADGNFDAVVDFGAVHHVPQWRTAVAEIRRVLRPGGQFCFLEVSKQFLDRWVARTFLDHPTMDRFAVDDFILELERQHIRVQNRLIRRWRGDLFSGVGVVQG